MSIDDPDVFLKKYGFTWKELESRGLKWNNIRSIIEKYRGSRHILDVIGRSVVDSLLSCSRVHSIKYRLKNEEHIAEKIIRKMRDKSQFEINSQNYQEHILDLVGVRALHLFKEDWAEIHKFILNKWSLISNPIAYVRRGDSDKIIQYYRERNCEIREHKYGYRSVHYRVDLSSKSSIYPVEIQCRTIFEEAWGEIDHVMRYPYDQENELMLRLSLILNHLAANADELATYMRYLKHRTNSMEHSYSRMIREKNRIIASMKKKVEALEITNDSKQELAVELDALSQTKEKEVEIVRGYPWLEHFMESNLFQNLNTGIKNLLKTHELEGVDISVDELELLVNAQKDLVRLIKNTKV